LGGNDASGERTKSTFGRFVVLVWLFVVLIITSSYTANLTSILTVQQLNPSIGGISSLQSSNDPIGYHNGSFVKTQLIGMNIASERLVPLASMEAFAEALTLGPKKGGVTAIVEELPFVEIFLETHCGFTQAGDSFTKSGWGFVRVLLLV
jgi:ionotropic glutamate receptor